MSFRVNKNEIGSGDNYCVNGFVLEHNSDASNNGFIYGCFLEKEERKMVDEYIELFKKEELKEKDLERLVSNVLKPALRKHGEGVLYR